MAMSYNQLLTILLNLLLNAVSKLVQWGLDRKQMTPTLWTLLFPDLFRPEGHPPWTGSDCGPIKGTYFLLFIFYFRVKKVLTFMKEWQKNCENMTFMLIQ